jgi:hypothetical protein
LAALVPSLGFYACGIGILYEMTRTVNGGVISSRRSAYGWSAIIKWSAQLAEKVFEFQGKTCFNSPVA